MSKKIWAKGLIAVLVIIFATVGVLAFVESNRVDDVEGFSVSSTSDKNVELSWKNVKNADGYKVTYSLKDSENVEKTLSVENNRMRLLTISVDELEQATEYDFNIVAFKEKSNDKVIVSKQASKTIAMTLPSQQKIEVESPDEGLLNVTVKANDKVEGYEVQYELGKNSDFKDAEIKKLEGSGTVEAKLKELKAKETYSVRARSYMHYNNELVYGEWSKAKNIEIAEKVEMTSKVDPSKPMIALSFDDGPSYNGASERILDVLEKYNARASYYMLGSNAKANPENLKRKIKLGCEIGNHTYDHEKYGNNVTVAEIKDASEAIYKACGQYPTSFRSPGGMTTDTIRSECKKENMPIYYWSVDTEDWKSRNADSVYNIVMNQAKDGDIVLMHEIYDSTADAVERIVPDLIKKGYQLVTCEELIMAKTGKKPQSGVQYITANETN